MKVRTKFTFWIALSSFLAALFFSTVVYLETAQEPSKLIKRELVDVSTAISAAVEQKNGEPFFTASLTDYPLERYYVRLLSETGTVIYTSPLAELIDIPLQLGDGFNVVKREVPPQKIWFDPLEKDDSTGQGISTVKFQVLQVSSLQKGQSLQLTIAKPLAFLTAELNEIIHEILIILSLSTIGIVIISYYLAGKLLKPISHINKKVKEIRDSSLDERISLGKSEDELHTLTVSLNAMFDRLQYSFTKQKEFISSAAHEMKIPLAITMLGMEDILSKDLNDEVRSELNSQQSNLRRLNKLVKDLLDISHLEHQETVRDDTVELKNLLTKALADFEIMFQVQGIQCTTNIETINVRGEEDKLLRVFINLVDNAMKYNLKSSGYINITATEENNRAVISIANSGKTIPEADLPHLFERFYRVEKSRATKYGGTGLGLTIVKKIIELHGGSISAESTNNSITFTLTLPVA